MQESKKVIAGMFSSIDVPSDFLLTLARSIAEESIRNGIKVEYQIALARDKFKLTDREIIVLVDNLAQLGIDVVPNKDFQYIPVDKRNEEDEHIFDSYPGLRKASVKIARMYGSRYEDLEEEIKKLKDQLKESKDALKECSSFKSPQRYQTLRQLVDVTEKRIKELEQSAKLAKAGTVYLPSSTRPFTVRGFLLHDKLYMIVQASDGEKLVVNPSEVSTESPFEAEDKEDAPSIIIQIKRDIQTPLPNEVTDIGEKLLSLVVDRQGMEDVGDMKGVKRFIQSVLDYIQQHVSDVFANLDTKDTEALKSIIDKMREYNDRYKLGIDPSSFQISLPAPEPEPEEELAPVGGVSTPSGLSTPEIEEPVPVGGVSTPTSASFRGIVKNASTANPDKGIATALKHLDRIAVLADEYATIESFKKNKTVLSALNELRHAVSGLKFFITETLPYSTRTEKEAAVVTLQNIVKSLEGIRPSTQNKRIDFVISSLPVIKKATSLLLTIEEV